tara:strand:+ start:1434 stop:1880 length:447 start_codon:yes stop_codon:yes gene_type:complete
MIYNIINLIATSIKYSETSIVDEFISDYQQIEPIEDPLFWLSCGVFICLMSGLIFADIMKSKLNNWTFRKISPLPLNNPRTVSSWFTFFSGLTIIFTAALSILNFAFIKSIIFSIIISTIFGVSMWKAIKDLLIQVESGTIKEIDEFF